MLLWVLLVGDFPTEAGCLSVSCWHWTRAGLDDLKTLSSSNISYCNLCKLSTWVWENGKIRTNIDLYIGSKNPTQKCSNATTQKDLRVVTESCMEVSSNCSAIGKVHTPAWRISEKFLNNNHAITDPITGQQQSPMCCPRRWLSQKSWILYKFSFQFIIINDGRQFNKLDVFN